MAQVPLPFEGKPVKGNPADKEEKIVNMGHAEELGKLEKYIEKILVSHNSLKKECENLKEKLHKRDTDCSELHESLESLHEERKSMRDRVSGLIGKIEDWEKSQKK